MIIAFVGHSFVPLADRTKEMVKEQIRESITNEKNVTFYLGGYGDFDEICAVACKELKQEYSFIERLYVTPYISLSEQAKIREMQNQGLCDASIYPPIENVPLRFAISKRNEWMLKQADLIIAYVKRTYGSAKKSLEFAKRIKKKIINICDFI